MRQQAGLVSTLKARETTSRHVIDRTDFGGEIVFKSEIPTKSQSFFS